MTLEVTILGCGSSGGVPRGDGDWGACDPAEPRNRRTRCSALIRRHGQDGVTTALIDTSPDLRQQMLMAGVKAIDAVLYTHDHADQTHGIDDLRVFVMRARKRIPAWMDEATETALRSRFPYIFDSQEGYPALLDGQRIPPHGQGWSVSGGTGVQPLVDGMQVTGCCADVFGTVNLSAGTYEVETIYNEIAGGATLAVFAAYGRHTRRK